MFKRYASLLLAVCGLAVLSAPASAFTDDPGWEVNSHSYPTNLPPGGSGEVIVEVYDVGAAASSAGATVSDTLPEGVSAVSGEGWSCTATTPITCTRELASISVEREAELLLSVNVKPGSSEGRFPNEVAVAGGGAPNPASASDLFTINSTPARFGFADADAWFTNADGTVDTQAGSHPYEVTFNFDLNADAKNEPADNEESRNITVNLPPGLIGNPNAVPQCTRQQFDDAECPASSQIGIAPVDLGGGEPTPTLFSPAVFNLVPPPGVPAEFAFNIEGIHAILDAAVRSGGDYGITEHVYNAPQRKVVRSRVTLWGVPADPSHDQERGETRGCEFGCASGAALTPFLTLPTSCAGPQPFSVSSDTWASASTIAGYEFLSHDNNGTVTGFTGCDHLGFGPSISVAPDTSEADTPAGVTVEVKVPQEGLLSTEGLSTANIENTTVTLPNDLVINPGQAAGLAACPLEQDGVDIGEAPGDEGPAACPSSSRVGEDEIETPLLTQPLKGDVYVLRSNPPELKLLVAASGEGVNVKLVGDVHLNETTGQLTTTFTETPELPFTDFKLSFSGGAQAALATPTQCGEYTTASDFTPWSSPFIPDVFPSSSFAINAGSDGAPCPSSPLPFSPSMIAGSTTDQAGGFTNFSLLLQRGDGQQRIEKLQFKAPQGLSGMISSVPLCPEPQASAGTCSAASQIGHAVVTSGPGPYPLVLPQPDDPELPIYLTGPYKGAPFGLAIVTPVIAGPFNLGTIVTRASIAVDPHTAQITITTDPLPQIVKGVPTDLRSIDSVIDRPGFMVNPTNCNPQSFLGTATGAQGAVAPISSPFQVGSCRSLEFAPKFQASIDAQSTKADGESLTTKLSYPNAPQGTQANITKVKVDLPIQLPSRLTTLQKACLASVFEVNPAGCPSQSIVGQAKVITPLLPVPLTGPAYFVSHGGEAFPSLTIVLQGDGVTVDLVGTTFISKAGITSTTFDTTPDTPFNTFELTLPQGKFSALGANLPASAKYSFCGQKLIMPTLFAAQNGLEIHQSTPISVTGCPKALTRPQKVAVALKACKKKPKGKRANCEKQARRKYRAVKKK